MIIQKENNKKMINISIIIIIINYLNEVSIKNNNKIKINNKN